MPKLYSMRKSAVDRKTEEHAGADTTIGYPQNDEDHDGPTVHLETHHLKNMKGIIYLTSTSVSGLAEFDFRYNNRAKLGIEDAARADALIRGIVGKRLTYTDSSEGRV